jgi:hypothetical protein
MVECSSFHIHILYILARQSLLAMQSQYLFIYINGYYPISTSYDFFTLTKLNVTFNNSRQHETQVGTHGRPPIMTIVSPMKIESSTFKFISTLVHM